jgi:hypothetical protein
MPGPIRTFTVIPSTSRPGTFQSDADTHLEELVGWTEDVNAFSASLNTMATDSTSVTSLAIGTGEKSLTVEAGKSYFVGMTVKIALATDGTKWMVGDITSYNGNTGALVVNVTGTSGSGTYDNWVIFQAVSGVVQVDDESITNEKLAPAARAAGKQTCWIPAGAMKPRSTNGAAPGTVQGATNGTMIASLDFDTATVEYAQFAIRMPKGWDESTVTFTPVWTANSTSTNGVAWTMRAKALGNDETIDAAWGSDVTVTDNNTSTAYQNHIAAESDALTIANASEQEWVVFEIYRNVSNGSDTLAVDALLLGVTLNYTTNAANDA